MPSSLKTVAAGSSVESNGSSLRDESMVNKPYNVLFICTGNSARSILSEAILNHLGDSRFKAYSAGSFPKGEVHPLTLEILQEQHFDVSTLRSKSWDEFSQPGAPEMDFIITVCDKAGGEVCPIWPGHPITVHWGYPDPAAAEGDHATRKAAFAKCFREISQRLRLFTSLPIDKIDRLSLHHHLVEMGKAQNSGEQA